MTGSAYQIIFKIEPGLRNAAGRELPMALARAGQGNDT
jgi:hypothetical protein